MSGDEKSWPLGISAAGAGLGKCIQVYASKRRREIPTVAAGAALGKFKKAAGEASLDKSSQVSAGGKS